MEKVTVIQSSALWLSQTMTWLYRQVCNLPAGIENHVVCDRVSHRDQFPVANLHSAENDAVAWRYLASKSWKIRKWRQERLLSQVAEAQAATVLHSHFGDQGWLNIGAAKSNGLRHVVTFYGYDASRLPVVNPVWRDRFRELFETADMFLCEGPHLAQCLIDLGCPAKKARVHHLGIALDEIRFRERTWQPGSPLRVLIAGTFVEKKGMTDAIKALGRIRENVELEVVIVGDSNGQQRSDTEKNRLIEAIRDCGLQQQTRLAGYQPYKVLMEEAYKCHIFLSPSVTASDGDTEGGAPVSIIEMAASGMPVVSTRHCDIPEIIEDNVSGLLAEESDVDGLEQRLLRLVKYPDDWKRFTANARTRMESEFDAVQQGRRLGEIYRELDGR